MIYMAIAKNENPKEIIWLKNSKIANQMKSIKLTGWRQLD